MCCQEPLLCTEGIVEGLYVALSGQDEVINF